MSSFYSHMSMSELTVPTYLMMLNCHYIIKYTTRIDGSGTAVVAKEIWLLWFRLKGAILSGWRWRHVESLHGSVRGRIPWLRLQPLGICFNVVLYDASALLLRARINALERNTWWIGCNVTPSEYKIQLKYMFLYRSLSQYTIGDNIKRFFRVHTGSLDNTHN
jgi:hypothetical protein